MFDYIKKISIAIRFIESIISKKDKELGDFLKKQSVELIVLAQKFKGEEYDLQNLIELKDRLNLNLDIIDLAYISGIVSKMNAQIFISSISQFLKYLQSKIIEAEKETKTLETLKDYTSIFDRKIARESAQSIFNSSKLYSENSNLDSEVNKDAKDDSIKVPTNFIYSQKDIDESFGKISYLELVDDKNKDTRKVTGKTSEDNVVSIQSQRKDSDTEIEERRTKILKILQSGGGNIKDISDKITGVNEKTLQRDLIELMRSRKVIMLGKKRWAKYYLK